MFTNCHLTLDQKELRRPVDGSKAVKISKTNQIQAYLMQIYRNGSFSMDNGLSTT